MLALVLMVGVVIDDAIVVLENVFHCIEEKGMDPIRAAIEGTREIGLAVLATTLSLVIVFLPVSFLSSVTGRMLYEFGITATVAILVSMLVSFTLTPMMCSQLLRTGRGRQPGTSISCGLYHWLETGYMMCLRWAMRHRLVILLLCVATVVTNGWLYKLVQQDYIPTNVDESEFEVRVTAREGASIRSMDQAISQVEALIRDIPGVELVMVTVGSSGVGNVNRGDVFIRLKDIRERSFSLARWCHGVLRGDFSAAWRGNFTQRDKMAEVRRRLQSLPDLRASVRNLTSLRQGIRSISTSRFSGLILGGWQNSASKFAVKASELPGVVDVDITLRLDKPELLVSIDRERAAALGVEVQEVADTLRVAVGGDDRVSALS